MAQQLNGRRGAVFAVRIIDADRRRLEELQQRGGGPRALGPWLVWRALQSADSTDGTTRPGRALPARGGTTRPDRLERALPDDKSTSQPVDKSQRVILDLCAGSGSWSQPYVDAGYDVRRVSLPELDVRTYVPPANVWGVLAAPPCDQFSLARNGCETPRDLVRGMETVNACMRVVLQCRPRWWALENPVGLLSKYLGTARDVFEPCDFGDPWTKRTALWGEFELPTRGPYVEPKGGGPYCAECTAPRASLHCSNPAHRAITPPGFARAFCEANP